MNRVPRVYKKDTDSPLKRAASDVREALVDLRRVARRGRRPRRLQQPVTAHALRGSSFKTSPLDSVSSMPKTHAAPDSRHA